MTTLPDIHKVIHLKAPVSKVWTAVATSEGLAAWFMPNDFEPLEGKEFMLHGPFGPVPCKVTEIQEPTLIRFNWGEDWTVTMELKDLDGATEFTLIHGGWVAGKDAGHGMTYDMVRDRMNNGWASEVLPRLAKLVEA